MVDEAKVRNVPEEKASAENVPMTNIEEQNAPALVPYPWNDEKIIEGSLYQLRPTQLYHCAMYRQYVLFSQKSHDLRRGVLQQKLVVNLWWHVYHHNLQRMNRKRLSTDAAVKPTNVLNLDEVPPKYPKIENTTADQ